MSIKSVPLDSVPDVKILPAGEYQLRLEDASKKFHKDESGNPTADEFITIRFAVINQGDVSPVYYSLYFPRDTDEEASVNFKARSIKMFRDALGLSITNTEVDEVLSAILNARGTTVWANLVETETKTGEKRNEVRKGEKGFIPPRR